MMFDNEQLSASDQCDNCIRLALEKYDECPKCDGSVNENEEEKYRLEKDMAHAIRMVLRNYGHFYDYAAGVGDGSGSVNAGNVTVDFKITKHAQEKYSEAVPNVR